MTVFFLDIRDFTSLSETMTPEQNFRFINSFLKRFGPIIRSNGGFVDKYLGDGIMALFPASSQGALAAAAAMRTELVEYNAGRQRAGHVPVRFGIGIHTGPLMLGTIGENRRMDSTVISDTVNVASRLEGLTKKFGADILVSKEAIEALPAGYGHRFEALGSETVKGKTKSIEVYRLAE
jgi:class 3 adenylate cyclase